MAKIVLLIEDDPIVRENTSEILELAGYEVFTAENGKKGVEMAKEVVPNIIICDILMPELDGYGVLQIISNLPQLQHIPFIFLTAKSHHEDLRKGMELGADDYINKPFEESELLRAIEIRLKRTESFENKQQFSSTKTNVQEKSLKKIKNFDQFLNQKKVYTYLKNETIYCEGNQSNHIFLIKKGLVKVYKMNELGKELITGIFSNNQYFGYTSFIKNLPHFENSTAITKTELYKITRDEIVSIINNNHQVLYDFIEMLANNLIEFKDQMLVLAYGSVREKTAFALLNLSEKSQFKSKKEIKISRSDLAKSIGIAKESLIRTLHDFKEENLISIAKEKIIISDKKRLQKVR